MSPPVLIVKVSTRKWLLYPAAYVHFFSNLLVEKLIRWSVKFG